MYPRIIIDRNKYRYNIRTLTNLCHRHGISMMAVTKVFCADKGLTDILKEERVDYIADSRVKNLEKISTTIPKVLLRLVSIHEVESVINNVDISLNSELSVIRALNEAGRKYNKRHGIILMMDIGDLREGIFYWENLKKIMDEVLKFDYIDLKGVGTNLTCFGGIIPTKDTLSKLLDITEKIESTYGIALDIVSGGNSSHLHLLHKDIHIDKINNLRIGEAAVLGRETAYGDRMENLYHDVFTLEADIIEYKLKPSLPEGDIGMDAFGKTPSFVDLGVIHRAILAIGKQDVDFRELIPLDKNLRLLGSSSDHVIIGIMNEADNYKVGDVIKFHLTYGSLLSLMTSPYVEKVYV